MKAKQLVALLIGAVVLVGLALYTNRREAPPTVSDIGKLILPDLPVNDIAAIVIENQGDTVTVQRVGGTWQVAEQYGYPADFDRVRNGIVMLSELKIGDVLTLSEDGRTEIGIAAPARDNADTTRITLSDAAGGTIATLLLGKQHMRKPPAGASAAYGGGGYPDGRYLAANDEDRVVVVSQTFNEFSGKAKNWIETDLLNIDAAEWARIRITGPDRDPLLLTSDSAGSALTLPDLGEAETLDTTKLFSLRNALAYLTLQEVADPSLGDDVTGLDNPAIFEGETRKGAVYRIALGGKAEGDARYVRISATYQEPEPDASETNAVDEAAVETTRKAVNDVNTRLATWVYVIPGYKADVMLTTRDALIKVEAEPVDEPADAAQENDNISEESDE